MGTLLRILLRLGVLLLTICRTVYCWMFLFGSIFGFRYVYRSIRGLMQSHLVDRGHIVSITTFAVYSIVWVIAWWMILREKPVAKRWAIAANLILIFNYLPLLAFGNWRGFLAAERDWWPFILIGVFGIIVFSIPYLKWREKWQMPTQTASYLDAVSDPVTNKASRLLKRSALLLLALFRALYCWAFIILSVFGIRVLYTHIRGAEKVDIGSSINFVVFSVVCGVAWWTLLRGKPSANQWAIAANVLLALPLLPVIITANWHVLMHLKLGWLVAISAGVFGILLFSIPYHGWRGKPHSAVQSAAE